MVEQRLRRAALFLVPLAVLGLSPRTVPFAAISALGYVSVAFLLRRRSEVMVWEWLYVGVAASYLVVTMVLTSDLSELGRSKASFLVFLIFPFAIAVSRLVEVTADIRPLLWGFVTLAMALAAVSVIGVDRAVLGEGRYQWQGNINAIAAVILMQFWLVRRKTIALPLLLLSLAGVAVAAAKQAVAVILVGASANLVAKVKPGRQQMRDAIALGMLLLLLLVFWSVISQLPVLQAILMRFGALRTGTGGYSFMQRQLLFIKAAHCFVENPGVGIGLGQFVNYPGWTAEQPGELHIYPHNVYLETLCEQGITGFAFLFVPLFVAAAVTFFAGMKRGGEPNFAVLLLFLAASTIAGLTGDISTRPLWVFGILMIRMLALRRSENDQVQQARTRGRDVD